MQKSVLVLVFAFLQTTKLPAVQDCRVYRLRISVEVTLLVKPSVTSIRQSEDVDCSHTGGTEDNLLSLHPTYYAGYFLCTQHTYSPISIGAVFSSPILCRVGIYFFLDVKCITQSNRIKCIRLMSRPVSLMGYIKIQYILVGLLLVY